MSSPLAVCNGCSTHSVSGSDGSVTVNTMRVEPIDLRPFREGSDSDRRRVAGHFDHAARTSGFLSISGHGVDPDLLAAMLDVTAQFFDRPPAEKMAYFVEDRAANRGYAPEGSEALAYSLGEQDLPTDLFEAFNCGLELTDEQLMSVDQFVLRIISGDAIEPADFYRIRKENEELRQRLEAVQGSGLNGLSDQLKNLLQNGGATQQQVASSAAGNSIEYNQSL